MKTNDASYSIWCSPKCGPIFGDCDLTIKGRSACSSDLGQTYNYPQFLNRTSRRKSFLAGSYEFELTEIEIYKRE